MIEPLEVSFSAIYKTKDHSRVFLEPEESSCVDLGCHFKYVNRRVNIEAFRGSLVGKRPNLRVMEGRPVSKD